MSSKALALTTNEFFEICESSEYKCEDIPILQAYLGGAFDLIATLQEQTKHIDKIYCTEPQKLFDIGKVIHFMHQHRAKLDESNAMLGVVRYFEEHGKC